MESPTNETAETGEWSFEGPTTIGEASYVGQDEESSPPDSASDVGSDERRSSDEGMTPDEGRIAVAVDFTPGRDEAEAPPSVAVSAEPDEPGRYEDPVVEPV